MVPKGISKRGEHSTGVHRMNVYDIDIGFVSSSRCSPQVLLGSTPPLAPRSSPRDGVVGVGSGERAGVRVVRALKLAWNSIDGKCESALGVSPLPSLTAHPRIFDPLSG